MTTSAHEQIRNLLGTYCELMDAGDFDGLGSLLGQARLTDDKGREIARGGPAITSLWQAMVMLYDGSPRTRHLVTGPVITVEGDAATSRSSFTVLQQVTDGPLEPIAAGRYRDSFACMDSTWHFTERQFLLDQEGDVSRHLRDL